MAECKHAPKDKDWPLVGRITDEELCGRCEAIVSKVRDRIAKGRLPRVPIRIPKPPRMTAMTRHVGEMPCAACDEQIAREHWAYPDYPPASGDKRRYDLHFHFVCHAI
jgi:hypothetical protein